jgi:hypothetical protein
MAALEGIGKLVCPNQDVLTFHMVATLQWGAFNPNSLSSQVI